MRVSGARIFMVFLKALPDSFHPVSPECFAQEFADIAALPLCHAIYLSGKILWKADCENTGLSLALSHTIYYKLFHSLTIGIPQNVD